MKLENDNIILTEKEWNSYIAKGYKMRPEQGIPDEGDGFVYIKMPVSANGLKTIEETRKYGEAKEYFEMAVSAIKGIHELGYIVTLNVNNVLYTCLPGSLEMKKYGSSPNLIETASILP